MRSRSDLTSFELTMGNMSVLEKTAGSSGREREKENAAVRKNARSAIGGSIDAGRNLSALDAFKRKISKAGLGVEDGNKEKSQRRMWCGLASMKTPAVKEDSTGSLDRAAEILGKGKVEGDGEGGESMAEEGKGKSKKVGRSEHKRKGWRKKAILVYGRFRGKRWTEKITKS